MVLMSISKGQHNWRIFLYESNDQDEACKGSTAFTAEFLCMAYEHLWASRLGKILLFFLYTALSFPK